MSIPSKPYTVTDAARQSEDIDRMFDELYRAAQDLDEEPAQTGATGAVGSIGPRGADGDEGESGELGQPGLPGAIGPIGLTGLLGRDGEDGEDGAMGASGLTGVVGASGAPGRDGDDADDSTWPTPIYVQASTNLTDSSGLARLSAIQSFTAANTWTATGNNFDEILAVDKGLQFPATQVASTGANVLDDYEEGIFTPIFGGSGTTSGQVYTTQIGRYVKIGKIVHAAGRVQLSTKGTITGDIQIKSLPFTVVNVTGYFPVGPIGGWSLATAYVFVCSELTPNTTDAVLVAATAAATSLSVLATANLNDTSALDFLFTYETAA